MSNVIFIKQMELKPEAYILCEVLLLTNKKAIAEYDTFWKTWFDENGNPIFNVWKWRPVETQCSDF